MKKLLLVLLCIPTLVLAQNKLSPYTKVFLEERKNATTEVQKVALRNFYSTTTNAETNEEYISGFLLLKSGYDVDELVSLGVEINTDLDSIFTASIPLSKLDEILSFDYVKRFEMGKPVFRTMNIARGKVGVDQIHNGEGGLPQGYTGKNTVIGVVDIGLQYDHINFYTKDRSDLRVKRVWDQSKKAPNAASRPAGFNYGREYKTKPSILSAKKDNTTETHGTHVAGMAAGSTTFKNYGGVAPDADIFMVSVDNSNDNAILDGIKYCFDSAEGKPCVVNVSWGSHVGPHDGTSSFDQALNALVGEKRIVVGSAGNEGSDYIHCGKTFSDTDTIMKALIKPVQVPNGDNYVVADVWGDTAQDYQLQLCIFDASGNEVFESVKIDTTASQTISLKNGGSGTFICVPEWNSTNNKINIYLQSTNVSLNSGHYLGFKIYGKNGSINAWLAYGNFYRSSFAGFTNGDNVNSVGEIGGTAERIITVGSFNTASANPIGGVSSFSSLGPTADGRTKPDVLAPGCVIISSVNGYAVTSAADMAQHSGWNWIATETYNGVKYRYGKSQGTSMSSPFMAGVISLWMENARFMTPECVKEVLAKTCTEDAYTSNVPNNAAGYGKVDALAGLIETFSFSSIEDIENSKATLICYPNPVVDKLKIFFPKTDKNVTVSVWNTNGQMVNSLQLDNVTNLQQETIDFSCLPSGLYIVRIAGDKTSETIKLQK